MNEPVTFLAGFARTFAPFAEPLVLPQRGRTSLGAQPRSWIQVRKSANPARSASLHSAQGQKSSQSENPCEILLLKASIILERGC